MKKLVSILCIVAAFVFAPKTMADVGSYGIYDYRISTPDDVKGWNMRTGEAYEAVKDSSLTLSIERNNTTGGFSYGTFLYDAGSKQIIAGSEMFIGSVGAGETGTSGVSVDYSVGDLAGIWVEYDGARYYSQNTLNSGNRAQVLGGSDSPEGYSSVYFDGAANVNRATAPIVIWATGSTPTGAPLPGVLATVALCGAVGGYLRRKKSAARIDQE